MLLGPSSPVLPRSIDETLSECVPNYEHRARGLLQFRDPNSMPPEKVFHTRRPIIAALEVDDLRRRSAVFGKVEKIRISRYDNESVNPAQMVWSEVNRARPVSND